MVRAAALCLMLLPPLKGAPPLAAPGEGCAAAASDAHVLLQPSPPARVHRSNRGPASQEDARRAGGPFGDTYCAFPPQAFRVSDPIVGTYVGAPPSGAEPLMLSELPPQVNLVMLAFATAGGDGVFSALEGWPAYWPLHIAAARRARRGSYGARRFLISLAGAAGSRSAFTLTVHRDEWIDAAFRSVQNLIGQYSADGAEVHFEHGTWHAAFAYCVAGLLTKLKSAGRMTAIGPLYGRTHRDYANLGQDVLDSQVDFINMQMHSSYRAHEPTVADFVAHAATAVGDFFGHEDKFLFGMNVADGNATPWTALKAAAKGMPGIRGAFTSSAEHSKLTQWCAEKAIAGLLWVESGHWAWWTEQTLDGTVFRKNCPMPPRSIQSTCAWKS